MINPTDALFAKEVADEICKNECPDSDTPIEKYSPQAPPPGPAVRPSGNNRAFVLVEPMSYEVGSTGVIIDVPAGFVTDYASIPPALWSVYSPHDQYSRAAIVHDYLYWSQLCTRKQADNIFMIAMKESNVPEATRTMVYQAVTTFGETSWDLNRKERIEKMPRVIPINLRNFPPNWSWEEYRKYLKNNDVSDPIFTDNGYCTLGNTTEIPNKTSEPKYTTKQYQPLNMVTRPKRSK